MAKKRLNLELSEETYKVINDLAEKQGVSMTEIIREGIALRDFAQEQKDLGLQLAVVDGDEIKARIITF